MNRRELIKSGFAGSIWAALGLVRPETRDQRMRRWADECPGIVKPHYEAMLKRATEHRLPSIHHEGPWTAKKQVRFAGCDGHWIKWQPHGPIIISVSDLWLTYEQWQALDANVWLTLHYGDNHFSGEVRYKCSSVRGWLTRNGEITQICGEVEFEAVE